MQDNRIQAMLDYGDAVADWLLDLGDERTARGDFEEALRFNYIAASTLSRQNRLLSSTRIEANLRRVAEHLSDDEKPATMTQRGPSSKEVCLHVITEALPAGGLTAMALRWIRNDPGRMHNIALLSQRVPIPDALLQVTSDAGGKIYNADPSGGFLDRAKWLRKLAREIATYVVLHVDVSDVICGAAFGVPGGPPVVLVNHSAHIFWNGTSIADLILNCRGSALEGTWASHYRGVPDYAIVPIPLPETVARAEGAQARKALGIPSDAIVLLTVGASFKYLPMEGLDFVVTCEEILRELPNAHLLAVGFTGDERWTAASTRTGSRLRTLGLLTQAQLATVHEAADIYIEGFPFGTTTALLESAHKGLPAVLAPSQCPPPYGTDGIALDSILRRPSTVEEYKEQILVLSRDKAWRTELGASLRDSIVAHHTGVGWKQHLENAFAMLPREHRVRSAAAPVRTPGAVHEHWSRFLPHWGSGYEASLELAVRGALAMGLRPRLTEPVKQASRKLASAGTDPSIPLGPLALFCNYILVPRAWAARSFGIFSFLCRGNLLRRAANKLGHLLGLVERPPSAYEEYRRAHGPRVAAQR